MNGSDGGGTRRSKRLGKGGVNSGDPSASQQPADVVQRERSASPVDQETDEAAEDGMEAAD
ncbi:unnamed protein product, partial [Closterium sp. Naga37s-1]